MQYIIAFLIFILVISFIGFLFSFLWPFLLALLIVTAIGNIITYHKRKKAMEEFYQNVQDPYESMHKESRNQTNTVDSDVIDVEYTETKIDQ